MTAVTTETVVQNVVLNGPPTTTPLATSENVSDHVKIGEIKASYDCVHRETKDGEDCAGKLQIGSNGIGFSGSVTSLVLPWSSMTRVEWDGEILCLQTAISEKDHRFASFANKKEVAKLIQAERLENDETERNYLAACAVAAMANFRSDSVYKLSVADDSKEKQASAVPHQGADVLQDGPVSPEQEAWTRLRNSNDPSFKEEAVAPLKLSCSLDTFYQEFFSDGARHSIARYQEKEIGDSELETTDWKEEEGEDARWTRDIRYRHPVTAPMAPPSALATKTQVMRRFGSVGLVLETRTVVLDVPLTDCFVVDDCIWVEASSDEEVTLEARFEIRFVKGTMFRRIIETTTRGEFKSWFSGLADMMTLALERQGEDVDDDDVKEEAAPAVPIEEATTPQSAPSGPATGLPFLWLMLFATGIAALVVLQSLTLMQMKALHGRIELLESLLLQQSQALIGLSEDESGNEEL